MSNLILDDTFWIILQKLYMIWRKNSESLLHVYKLLEWIQGFGYPQHTSTINSWHLATLICLSECTDLIKNLIAFYFHTIRAFLKFIINQISLYNLHEHAICVTSCIQKSIRKLIKWICKCMQVWDPYNQPRMKLKSFWKSINTFY